MKGISPRRTGFTQVITHDALVDRRHCGGPIINSADAAVGINLAHYYRNSTLVLPADRVQEEGGAGSFGNTVGVNPIHRRLAKMGSA